MASRTDPRPRDRGRRPGRHADRPDHWTHALAAQPWITLVLLGALLVAGLGLLTPGRYATQSSLSAPSTRAADDAVARLTDPSLVRQVEDAIELAPDLRGTVRLAAERDEEPLEVVLVATAPDPRLAAVAADTAVALVVDAYPEAGYALSVPAAVPTERERGRSLTWAWLTVVALVAAGWVERNHRSWLGEHPAAVAEGAR